MNGNVVVYGYHEGTTMTILLFYNQRSYLNLINLSRNESSLWVIPGLARAQAGGRLLFVLLTIDGRC